ncbi:ABC transporter substrate-binding protein [Bacillus sp. ISL-4]|uniref:ABC transporter substrate-binding protein n=1 Tax=Bacillus sp. ISL-4 TaxID=2819125 RepID=UPI001BE60526|nr:ABC transporter substrate-binding protein [Bacillus sp. ISL-4]MBT2667847.1 ABC transporter substrate-binding protein [Bacillus sp. ISL-4]MBT2674583.1 ABC transporter substrate-binding protein [Streptomyces sp. ISL-14]
MKSNKKIVYLLFAMCISMLVTGCSNDSSTVSQSKGKSDGKTLNLLTWEGYADPKLIKDFEEKYDVKITATYFGSSDELVSKLKGGGGNVYDVISPSSDVAGYLVRQGIVAPINVSNITNYSKIADKLKDMDDVKKSDKVYGIPYVWGPDSLIYDADAIKNPPESWDVFWDPKYKGKISLWDDISNIYLVGQMMGLDKNDPSAIYNMTDEQLQEAKKKLLEVKPQIRKYWATGGELNDLFANKEVVLAVGWPLTPKTVNASGRHLKEVIPKEGITGWIDRLMVVNSSPNKELAEKFIDYAISEKSQKIVSEVTGYSVANKETAKLMTPEEAKAIHVDDMDNYMKKINFWQEVKDRNKYNEIWNEVKAQ